MYIYNIIYNDLTLLILNTSQTDPNGPKFEDSSPKHSFYRVFKIRGKELTMNHCWDQIFAESYNVDGGIY